MMAVIVVKMVHLFQQLDLNARLGTERRLVLDDLDCDPALVVSVHGLHDLPERALAEQLPHFVALKPHLTGLDNVVVILIVIAAIEGILFC